MKESQIKVLMKILDKACTFVYVLVIIFITQFSKELIRG